MRIKKIVIVGCVFLAIASTSLAFDIGVSTDKAKSDIRQKVLSDYKDSKPTVQVYLIEQNIESYNQILNLDIDGYKADIMSNLISDYYPSFSVIMHLYEQNVKAYEKLHGIR